MDDEKDKEEPWREDLQDIKRATRKQYSSEGKVITALLNTSADPRIKSEFDVSAAQMAAKGGPQIARLFR